MLTRPGYLLEALSMFAEDRAGEKPCLLQLRQVDYSVPKRHAYAPPRAAQLRAAVDAIRQVVDREITTEVDFQESFHLGGR